MKVQHNRTAMLFGEDAVVKLQNSYAAIFGIGGVGAYVAEALARSGVGKIDLIDSDVVSESNINRQLIALHSTVGRPKTEVMAERIHDIEAFSFYVLDVGYGYISNEYKSVAKKDTSAEKQAILNFVENIYNEQSDEKYYMIDGLARPMGDEIWFSISASNRLDSVKADPLISGIRESRIVAYNRETKEFRTVFECNQKRVQIIDFDENAAYILDSNGEFGCVNLETKKTTSIHEFSGIDHITVNDKYIFVKYQRNGYTYFVYEKGGSIIANDSSLD